MNAQICTPTIETMRDDAPPFTRKLAALLKTRRAVDVARAMGVPEQTIYNWISRSTVPRGHTCLQLSRALGVPVEWLLDDDQPIDPPPPPSQLTEKLRALVGRNQIDELARDLSAWGDEQHRVTPQDIERYLAGDPVPADVAWRLAIVMKLDHDWLVMESFPLKLSDVVTIQWPDAEDWGLQFKEIPERGQVTLPLHKTKQIRSEIFRRYHKMAGQVFALLSQAETFDWKAVSLGIKVAESYDDMPDDIRAGVAVLRSFTDLTTCVREEFGFILHEPKDSETIDPQSRNYHDIQRRIDGIFDIVTDSKEVAKSLFGLMRRVRMSAIPVTVSYGLKSLTDSIKRYHEAGGPLLKS